MKEGIKWPLTTEKSVRLMEKDNVLTFIVDRKVNKNEIKRETESMFKVKVKAVNALILPNGKKKAYVRLDESTPARDVATQLGII